MSRIGVSNTDGGDDAPHRRGLGCASWTDQQLVLAAPVVREAAFAELFRRHSASLAAVARMVLGTASSQCDDVVAEVFAALWCAPERFEPARGSLLGFLRMSARGRSIDLLRSESSRDQRERNDESGHNLCSEIDAEIVASETRQELLQALARLPDAERAAIELAYFADMTYRAVAQQLEVPEGTIKSRIRSGMQRLRRQVKVEGWGSVDAMSVQVDRSMSSGLGLGRGVSE